MNSVLGNEEVLNICYSKVAPLKTFALFFLIIALNISFSTISLKASDTIGYSIVLSMGVNNTHISDRHVTPVIFRGFGIAPSFQLNRYGIKGIHMIEGSFYFSKLKAEANNYLTENTGGSFRYSYLRSLINKQTGHGYLSVASGLSLSSMILWFDYYYKESSFWATALNSWYFRHSLGAAVQIGYSNPNKSGILLGFFLPVVSNISRPEFSSSGNYNYERNDWEPDIFGKTGSIFENPAFNIQVESHYRINNKFNMRLNYEFYYSKYPEPDLIRFYMQNLSIGMEYKF